MFLEVLPDKVAMGRVAAEYAADGLRQALAANRCANLVIGTGASQYEMLEVLVAAQGVDWSHVTIFHLDEYIGLSPEHPASFRYFLHRHFIDVLPRPPCAVHEVNGSAADSAEECRRLGELFKRHPTDVACIGIGENGHIAFNDPPADFGMKDACHVVTLDQACRQQQVGEGWFATLKDVPKQAISMSVPQILKSRRLVVTVPDARKARAVQACVEGPMTALCPASVLMTHADCGLFLEPASAQLLSA